MLLSLHRTATLRHDQIGAETLLNLLLRNYLHFNLYDQVSALPALWLLNLGSSYCIYCNIFLQAEKLRAKAQQPDASRSSQQYARYLYYMGRIRAIQLEYTEAKECLQQAARKVLRISLFLLCHLVHCHARPHEKFTGIEFCPVFSFALTSTGAGGGKGLPCDREQVACSCEAIAWRYP